MRRLLKSLVAGLVFPVHECGNGAEALALCATQRPDWILLDIDTKTIDGISATCEIKAVYPETRIIIFTGYDEADLREAAQEAGACAYVLKENLLAIRELLETSVEAKAKNRT